MITLYGFVLNFFILAMSVLMFGLGVFMIMVVVLSLWDWYTKSREGNG